MENVRDLKQKNLISELNHGKEVANQLRNLLQPNSVSVTESFLIENIQSSFEKALSIITRGASMEKRKSINGGLPEKSDEQSCKKRKLLPHWSQQVKACTGTGLEGSCPGDGYSWRKYGQKDILGSSFPRGYYRCTHRRGQGCLATKHVQRSDEDPNIFLITYKGRHTCSQTPLQKRNPIDHRAETPEIPQEMFVAGGGKGLAIKTEDHVFPSFVVPSHLIGSEETNFTESMENLFTGSSSPSISEAGYLNPISYLLDYDVDLQISESDFSEIIFNPTSVTNSLLGEFNFPLDFPFQDLEFFS